MENAKMLLGAQISHEQFVKHEFPCVLLGFYMEGAMYEIQIIKKILNNLKRMFILYRRTHTDTHELLINQ